MGKDTGFLEYDRKEPGYRHRDERLKDYRAVEYEPEEDDIYDQSARCMDCGIPFCHGYGCPVANIIPEFNDFVYRGKWREALDILLSSNNFPEFTGRVCPATCETACVAGINGEPVTIRQIELAIIEMGFNKGLISPLSNIQYSGETVAVIGSGPAGLAAADTLNKAGFRITVFDDAEYPGGILRYGIPDFKLEKRIVERRIKLMEEEGVVFETGILVGTDVSARYIKKHFDAVCLACGARKPRDLSVPGRDLSGIYFAMDYLIQQNQRVMEKVLSYPEEISASGKSVVVIGGGDTGSDCVGTALRQGAKNVIQLEILPEPPRERPDAAPWPMWPVILRETHAHKEGGTRIWAVTTTAFAGKNGSVSKLQCAEVTWQEKDSRRFPVEIEETEFEITADIVILAMGFTGPGNTRLIEDFQIKTDPMGNVWTNSDLMTNCNGIFAAGDMATGQSLVVKAIHSGRKAAMGIIQYLSKIRNKQE